MLYKASKPGLSLLCSFCVVVYIVMDACLLFILFDLVFQYLTKILAAKKVSEMAFLCRVGHKTISQSIDQFCHLWFYCYEFLFNFLQCFAF